MAFGFLVREKSNTQPECEFKIPLSKELKESFLFLQNYFRDTWNIFDFITVLGSITEIVVDLQVIKNNMIKPLTLTERVYCCDSLSLSVSLNFKYLYEH